MKILLLAMFFLLLFMQGSAAAQKDRMKLGEKLDVKVSRSKGERKVVEPKTKETPEAGEKLDTKVERKAK